MDSDRGAIIATVMGDRAFRLLLLIESTSWGLVFDDAVSLIRSGRRDPKSARALSVVLRGKNSEVGALVSYTACAIEVVPREPAQFEKPLGLRTVSGSRPCPFGSVKWTAADGKSQQIGQRPRDGINSQLPVMRHSPSLRSIAPNGPDRQRQQGATAATACRRF